MEMLSLDDVVLPLRDARVAVFFFGLLIGVLLLEFGSGCDCGLRAPQSKD
jgi:hypothetical protein